MTRMLLLGLMVMAATGGIAANATTRGSIPAAFHGDWALESGDCAGGPTTGGNMRIAARKVTLFDMIGKVTRVTTVNASAVYVHSRIRRNNTTYGSIEIYDNLELMSLSPDGQTLAVGEDEVMLVYKRCGK